jgi:hypothetical protein
MKKLLAIAALLFLPLAPAMAAGGTTGGTPIDKSVAPVSFTETIDLQRIDRFSLQANYSDGTPSAITVDDGRKSTATVTIEGYADLTARSATVQITISSFSAVDNHNITLNGVRFKEGAGGNWDAVATATATATALAAAIDSSSFFDAAAVSTVVYTTATVVGTHANTWTVTSSTAAAMVISNSTFEDGKDNAKLAVETVVLVAGTDFTAAVSSVATVNTIILAVNADSTLSALVTASSTTPGIMILTADDIGVNAYDLFTSAQEDMILNASTLSATATLINGSVSDIETDTTILGISSDTIRYPNHSFVTGLGVLYSTPTVGSDPAGLIPGTTYYVIRTDGQDFLLASSTANALVGTAVDITAITGGGEFTFTPYPLTGVPSFKWQASNDNSNWSDVAVDSFTWSSAGSTLWDYAEPGYRYLRINYTHPNEGQGGLALTIYLFGRLDD